MKILITGGAGFIGSALARRIVEHSDHEVLVFDKLTYAGTMTSLDPVADNPRFRFIGHDISNPLNDQYNGLVTSPDTSAAETIRSVLPEGSKLVKAFNTTFAGTLVEGQVGEQPLDVFIAGDDETAKEVVKELVLSGGMHPVDVGALERARQLEAIGLLGITLQGSLGTGFMSGWKLVLPKAA